MAEPIGPADQSVDIRPGDLLAFARTFELGDTDVGIELVAVRLRLRWLERLGRWQMSVQTPNGRNLTPWLLVQPGGTVPWSNTDLEVPQGRLLWQGPDDYGRDDLGTRLLLWFLPRARPADLGNLIPEL
jgi:hypothetical protein